MRVQSTFEKFAQTTHGKMFVFCFVLLRMVLGMAFLMTPQYLNGLEISQLWDDQVWFDVVAMGILLVCGTALFLGLFVRPAALLAVVVLGTFVVSFLSLDQTIVQLGSLMGVFMLGMFAAGGAGHAFGLDGLVLRNIRRPGQVTRFLFG